MSDKPDPKPLLASMMARHASHGAVDDAKASAVAPAHRGASKHALRVRLLQCAGLSAVMAAIAALGSFSILVKHLEPTVWLLATSVGLMAGLTVLTLGRRLLTSPMQHTLNLLHLSAQPTPDSDAMQLALHGAIASAAQTVMAMRRQIDACQLLVRESDQRLEEAVIERTVALTQARDEADAGNRAKSRFLANMSHEIRTPLNGVLGITELMLKGELTPQQRRYAEIVRQSGATLLHTLNEVLDLAKVEAGRLEIEQIPFRPLDVIEEALQLFAQAARGKGLRLAWALDRSLSQQMVGDPHRIRQILANLLSNAVKFTAKGEIELRAALHEREPEPDAPLHSTHRALVFSVKDTGIGIDAEKQQAVFEPFFQADGAHARSYGGTGLGLAIVQQLAQLMHGRVELDSAPGKGSRFTVVLPAPMPLSPDAQTRPAVLGGLVAKLLLHDRALRSYLADQLEALGMQVDDDPVVGAQVGAQVDLKFIDEKTLSQWRRGDAHPAMSPRLGTVLVVADINRHPQRPPEVAMLLQAPWRQLDLWQKLIALVEAPLASEAAAAPVARAGVANAAGMPTEANESAAAITVDRSSPPAQVLLVEDNPVNAELARTIFQLVGAQVQWVENGADAVALVRRQSFNAIFMDLQMPVMDGFEATRLIRNMESRGDLQAPTGGRPWSRLPIIALTANALAGDRERCLAAGFDEHIAKPFSMDEAAAALQRWAGTPVG